MTAMLEVEGLSAYYGSMESLHAASLRVKRGEIAVLVQEEDSTLKLGVTDRGPGIPVERRDEARRRFGRLDPSRSEEGAGLGLSLVQAIAHLHQGELALFDNSPGLVALLQIPIRGDGKQARRGPLGLAL